MKIENYENKLWGVIYDLYNRPERHRQEFKFYSQYIKNSKCKVLEPACGTGLILLSMLENNIDVYGFDISKEMLTTLYENAKKLKIKDIKQRVIKNNFLNFKYKFKFDVVYIAARSFLHLTMQKDQIQCLKNINHHMKKGAKFIMNIYTPDMELLLEYAKPNQKFEKYETYLHPKTKKEIEVLTKNEHDLTNQLQYITWRFKYDGKISDSKMLVRWIHKAEFEALLKLAGFKKWKLYGDFNKKEYKYGDEMVFVIEK